MKNKIFDFDETILTEFLPRDFEDITKSVFVENDLDSKGALDREQIKKLLLSVMNELNFHETLYDEDIDELIAQLDENHNNLIDYEEFRKLFIGLYFMRYAK